MKNKDIARLIFDTIDRYFAILSDQVLVNQILSNCDAFKLGSASEISVHFCLLIYVTK